jgi:hypothetical protein
LSSGSNLGPGLYTPGVILLPLIGCSPMTVDLRTGAVDDSPAPIGACEDPRPIEVTLELDRLYADCPWSEGDNLEPQELIVSARVEESLGLAVDATICSVEVGEVVPYYDDGFFLVLGDAVLATSHAELMEHVEVANGLPRYDWASLAGQPFTEEAGWCLGQDEGSDCVIPGASSWEGMELSLTGAALQQLTGPLAVTWVTFGDNDDWTDCSHREMDLVLELQVGG